MAETPNGKNTSTMRHESDFSENLLNVVGSLVVVLDREGTIIRFNRACEETTGYTSEEVRGKRLWDIFLVYKEEAEVKGVFDSLIKGTIPSRHQNIWLTKQGDCRLIDWSNTVVHDENGEVQYVIATGIDITERRMFEEELRASEERIRYIIKHNPNAIAVLDNDLCYILVSDRFLHDYRLREKDIIGKCHYDVFPEVPDRWKEIHRRCLAGAIETAEDDLFIRVDGSVDTIRWEVRPWYDSHGQIGGIIMYTEVITERKRAEEALRESEARMRAIVNTAVDGIVTIDERGTIESINPAVEKIFGYTTGELMGQNVNILMPEPYHSEHNQYLANYLNTGISKIIGIGREVMGRRKDGTLFPIDLSVSEVRLKGRRIFTGIVRDISTRRRSEEALRESQERLQLATEGAQVGTWQWDLPADVITYSPKAAELFGLAPGGQLTKNDFLNLLHPDDRQRVSLLKTELEKEKTYNVEYQIIWPNGKTHWIQTRGRVVSQNAGVPTRLMGVVMDICERKRSEKALQQISDRLRALFEASPVGILTLQPDGVVTMWNPAAARIYGWTEEEVLGKPAPFIPEDRMHEFDESRARVLAGESFSNLLLHRRRKDGSLIDVSLSTAPLHAEDGSITGILGMVADVTDQRRTEEALRASEEKYRDLVQNAQSFMLRFNAQGQITFFNEYAQAFFGYTEEEVIGKHVDILVPPVSSFGRDLYDMLHDIILHPRELCHQ